MDNQVMMAIVIVVAVGLVVAAVWMVIRRRQTMALRQKSPPGHTYAQV